MSDIPSPADIVMAHSHLICNIRWRAAIRDLAEAVNEDHGYNVAGKIRDALDVVADLEALLAI